MTETEEIKWLADLLLRKSATDDEALNRRLLEVALGEPDAPECAHGDSGSF